LEVWNIPVFPVQWALRSMVSLSALSGREARAAWWDHSPALFASSQSLYTNELAIPTAQGKYENHAVHD
jgi:hypothetical protein